MKLLDIANCDIIAIDRVMLINIAGWNSGLIVLSRLHQCSYTPPPHQWPAPPTHQWSDCPVQEHNGGVLLPGAGHIPGEGINGGGGGKGEEVVGGLSEDDVGGVLGDPGELGRGDVEVSRGHLIMTHQQRLPKEGERREGGREGRGERREGGEYIDTIT